MLISFLIKENMEGRIIKDLLTNLQIKTPKVFVIDNEGKQIGEMQTNKALELAENDGLDLVLVSPNANPQVCKIMDYGKFKFENAKKEKENKKNQKIVEMKNIELSMKIKEYDMQYRANQVLKFAEKGFKVKAFIKRSRGRAQIYDNKGIDILLHFAKLCESACSVEKQPEFGIADVTMILVPKKNEK